MAPNRSWAAALLLAVLVLTSAAWLRGAEYDEQYTLFLTAGSARPDWPQTAFPAGTIATVQSGHAGLGQIARDLRATDVHPPLYFWAMSIWRDVFGPSLFAARMLSVVFGIGSLSLVGSIARRCAIRPLPAMLLTLGCYGFVYTNAIARGFAPAQMLTLSGVSLLLSRRPLLAGLSFGTACCCNYLVVFIACAAIAVTGAWLTALSAVPFLALDLWFFAAQHAARTGQFESFRIFPSLLRLAEYQTASVFGGLPLYVDGIWRVAVGTSVGALAATLVVYACGTRPWRAGPAMRMIFAATVATPIGLLLLGAVFDNTPIELRYLSFGLPFIALSITCAASSGYFRPLRSRLYLTFPIIFAIQSASIAGLLLSPRTMQPARATATEAARLIGNGVVLLPRGNDGVGIVGAFGIEAPRSLPIRLIRSTDSMVDCVVPYHRVLLALLGQDRDSRATIAILHTALTRPNWRLVAIGSNLEVYERTDQVE